MKTDNFLEITSCSSEKNKSQSIPNNKTTKEKIKATRQKYFITLLTTIERQRCRHLSTPQCSKDRLVTLLLDYLSLFNSIIIHTMIIFPWADTIKTQLNAWWLKLVGTKIHTKPDNKIAIISNKFSTSCIDNNFYIESNAVWISSSIAAAAVAVVMVVYSLVSSSASL